VSKKRDAVSTRPLLDKLGVRQDARVVLIDITDPEFRRLLRERTEDVHDRPVSGADLVFLGVSTAHELHALADLRLHIKDDGAIWVVRPKGIPGALNETGIIEAALANGLVDNKVVSFSPTHSALRLVIPVNKRHR
jgi:hypothetical protein